MRVRLDGGACLGMQIWPLQDVVDESYTVYWDVLH